MIILISCVSLIFVKGVFVPRPASRSSARARSDQSRGLSRGRSRSKNRQDFPPVFRSTMYRGAIYSDGIPSGSPCHKNSGVLGASRPQRPKDVSKPSEQ